MNPNFASFLQMKMTLAEEDSEKQQDYTEADYSGRRFFVSGLPSSMDDVRLFLAFEPTGGLSEAHIVKPGLGYVVFVDFESADRAIESMKDGLISGKEFYMKRARSFYIHKEEEARIKLEEQHHNMEDWMISGNDVVESPSPGPLAEEDHQPSSETDSSLQAHANITKDENLLEKKEKLSPAAVEERIRQQAINEIMKEGDRRVRQGARPDPGSVNMAHLIKERMKEIKRFEKLRDRGSEEPISDSDLSGDEEAEEAEAALLAQTEEIARLLDDENRWHGQLESREEELANGVGTRQWQGMATGGSGQEGHDAGPPPLSASPGAPPNLMSILEMDEEEFDRLFQPDDDEPSGEWVPPTSKPPHGSDSDAARLGQGEGAQAAAEGGGGEGPHGGDSDEVRLGQGEEGAQAAAAGGGGGVQARGGDSDAARLGQGEGAQPKRARGRPRQAKAGKAEWPHSPRPRGRPRRSA